MTQQETIKVKLTINADDDAVMHVNGVEYTYYITAMISGTSKKQIAKKVINFLDSIVVSKKYSDDKLHILKGVIRYAKRSFQIGHFDFERGGNIYVKSELIKENIGITHWI